MTEVTIENAMVGTRSRTSDVVGLRSRATDVARLETVAAACSRVHVLWTFGAGRAGAHPYRRRRNGSAYDLKASKVHTITS